MTFTPSVIKFSTVDNGARNHGRPFIQANVDGVRVRWDVDHGWRCDKHRETAGMFMCNCSLSVLGALSRRIQDRIQHLVDCGKGMGGWSA